MKKYKVIISEIAKEQIKNAKRYIRIKFKNQQALKHLSNDIKETKERLKNNPKSARDYDNEKGTKDMHLQMNYKFIFSFVDDDTVLIEEFLHDLQDE